MRARSSAPVPAVSRAPAAVVLALVRPLEGARPLAPVPVVAPLVPVLLGGVGVIPGFALRTRAGFFPFVTVPICALQLLPAVFGLEVRRAVVVVAAGAAAVAAGPASRPRAVRSRQAAPIVVAYGKALTS